MEQLRQQNTQAECLSIIIARGNSHLDLEKKEKNESMERKRLLRDMIH